MTCWIFTSEGQAYKLCQNIPKGGGMPGWLIAIIVVSAILTYILLAGGVLAWWTSMIKAHRKSKKDDYGYTNHDFDDIGMIVSIGTAVLTPIAGLVFLAAYHLGHGWPLVGTGLSRKHREELRYEALKTQTMDDQARAARELEADTLKLKRALDGEEDKPSKEVAKFPPQIEVRSTHAARDQIYRSAGVPRWDERFPRIYRGDDWDE